MYELSQYYQGLLEGLFAGDKRALARLMSLVEERPKEVYALMSRVCKRVVEREKPTPRLGITGPPGAGKSTLIDQLIRSFRKQGRSVGAVVIDPSSPFSGGAVLGDRVRMQEHSLDEGVFVRSLGASAGGLWNGGDHNRDRGGGADRA
jgi:LAO/AO transport system kinase